MLAIARNRILFVHIHKNAGKSVKAFMRRSSARADKKKPRLIRLMAEYLPGFKSGKLYGRQWKGRPVRGHEKLAVLLETYPEMKGFFKFTAVRDPWDRLVSAYYWVRGRDPGSPRLNRDHLAHIPDFEHFIRALYLTFKNKGPGVFHLPTARIRFTEDEMIYPSQASYILDPQGKMLADAWVRQESLETDLKKILAPVFRLRMDQFPGLTRVGRSKRPGDYMSQYNDETKQMVAEIYAPDIELFGYEFDPSTPGRHKT